MFHAVTPGKDFAQACKQGAFGKAHSVFERALNVELAEGGLLTMLCGGADVFSASCVATAPAGYWESQVKPGDNVIFTPDIMYVENVPVVGKISAANLWEKLSGAEIYALGKPAYTELLALCKELEEYLYASGRSETFPSPPLCDFNPVDFIGLGSGLTPSGDDFLAGMLHGMRFLESLYGRKCPCLPHIADSIRRNLHRTGSISRHFLRYALKGEWGRSTENFLVALVSGAKKKLYEAANAKLAWGANSGAEEMRGCLFGIRESVSYLRALQETAPP